MRSGVLHLHWLCTQPNLPVSRKFQSIPAISYVHEKKKKSTFVRTAMDANELPKLIPTTGANEAVTSMGISAVPLGKDFGAI